MLIGDAPAVKAPRHIGNDRATRCRVSEMNPSRLRQLCSLLFLAARSDAAVSPPPLPDEPLPLFRRR